jgi:hypothetical protein
LVGKFDKFEIFDSTLTENQSKLPLLFKGNKGVVCLKSSSNLFCFLKLKVQIASSIVEIGMIACASK